MEDFLQTLIYKCGTVCSLYITGPSQLWWNLLISFACCRLILMLRSSQLVLGRRDWRPSGSRQGQHLHQDPPQTHTGRWETLTKLRLENKAQPGGLKHMIYFIHKRKYTHILDDRHLGLSLASGKNTIRVNMLLCSYQGEWRVQV